MHSVHAEMWDPQPPSKHASPLPPRPPAHVTTASPAKRITFYKSGDSQFGGVRMAIHKRSFKCFDALLDDLSQKVPLPFGVRTVTTPRGTHAIKHLEQLQDGGCYLCSDRRQAKPVNMELAGKRPSIWYHHSRRAQRLETSSATPPGHSSHRQRRILLVKNSEPGMRRSVVLSRRSTRSLRAFLDEVSEVMQFHVRKLYTAEGRKIDSVQSLMTCPGVLVCVGREAFSPVLVNFIRKSSEEKLPGLGSRSPGLGPRTPGNGARSPAAQGARSPPHGAQSRASDNSEGPESKKNVNFGLETKKSIIHPRSDSSNRSTRFSLSSDKSYGNGVGAYSHARPAITNDDIEKRVLVNKDGSLSVEMRVRFRLHNDETLRWSTQLKKSPSLTNECCPLRQAQSHYLQQGQSESCSDPDSASFDPEGVDYSNQPQQRVLEGNSCPCCHQRPEQQYDLWENPAHSHRKPPVPPPHATCRTHTVVRHTHSSSSSSSCNSRRVVRCRARVSNRGGGSEQSQLVQEEMFVTEQVERRVEVEQDEESHVEVCRVSRCCSRSEVVSRKSVEDELMMEEEVEREPSVISSSSHVLQSLKEDQDDDLPPSASQCCHSNEPSPSPNSQTRLDDKPTSNVSAGSVRATEHKKGEEETGSRAVSAASSSHCGAAEAEEMDRAPSSKSEASKASCRSSKATIANPEEEGATDDEGEEVNRVVSGLSGHTGLSLQSRPSSVCPDCGGCKSGVNSKSNSRASQKSHHSKRASPKPSTPLSSQENTNNGSDDDGSQGSAVSTQSNKTNLTSNGRCSATSNVPTSSAPRAVSRTSRTSNPELAGKEEVRAPSATSATSHRSNRSHKSGCKGSGAAEKEEGRSPSAVSAQSNMSAKSSRSHKSNCSATADIKTREEAEGENTVERARSSLSAKSGASAKTSASVTIRTKLASPTDNTAVEEDDSNKRSPSALSVEPDTAQRPDSVLSAKSAKSNVSAKSGTSHRSTCSHCARVVSPADEPEATGQEEGIEAEGRAASAMSAKSNLSAKSNKSHKSTKAPERSLSPRSETGEGRAASQVSGRSVNSRENEMEEDEWQRSESVKSAKSASSAKSRRTNSPTKDASKTEDRTPSVISGKSHTSAKSSKSQMSNRTTASPNPNEADIPSAETNGEAEQNESGRVPSVISVKSKSSVRSRTSHKSSKNLKPVLSNPNVTIKSPEGVDEEGNETQRAQSAASVKSNASTSSHKSNRNGTAAIDVETADENVVEDNAPRSKTQDQMLSPRSTCPSRTRSPKAASPVQQLLPGPSVGETRGPSALSVHSTTSAKSGKSKCSCGAASAKDEEEEKKKQDNEELENEEDSDPPASILSSSTKRARRESGGTERPLTQNSGSVSLGLPEDQDTADSDSGKSSVSFHTNTERKSRVKTATPHVPKSTEQSSTKEEREGTGSIVSQKSSGKTTHNRPAVDIPTIETPGGSQHKGREQTTERGASAFSAKSSRSHKSSCNCGVKAAAQTEAGNYLETGSVKSVSSMSNGDGDNDAENLAISRPASKADRKEDTADNKAASVHSAQSGSTIKASEKSKGKDSVKDHKAKSSGSVKTSSSQKKEIKSLSPCPIHSPRPGSKVDTRSESTLSHSLSAADILKETMAAARPHSRQSKASAKSSTKRCERSRNQTDREELELSPACLPNASPNEVVSDWLRSIPANSSMLALGDEPNEEVVEENLAEEEVKEEEGPGGAEEQEKVEAEEGGEREEGAGCDAAEEEQSSDPAPGDPASSRSKTLLLSGDSLPRSLRSSAAVMKVLLRSSLGRCQSMPEVSPVYGRRLSTSARGLLDCLAQLQLIEPTLSPGLDPLKDQHYEDIMVILQSLWLTEPRNTATEQAKDVGTEQVSPPRSSSGLGMSSGSGGSGKENGNQPGGKTTQSETKEASLHEDGGAEKVVKEETGVAEEPAQSDPPSLDSPKATENPSSWDKSSANGGSKSPTDNERDDSSSATPPTVLRAPLSKRQSQDPDPVWVLHLLKKLEKQFMKHYINAMAEFKVRWDLDDSLVLDAMIGELKDEVSRRIQSSVECEVRKIQSRAGRGGRMPRPPQKGNFSRESTMTEKRRRILKVMKNQSLKTAESLSDGETTGECSDQRSDDEYCPCDACVRKKMDARPLRENPLAADAPVMKEFDLLKILQLKKSPTPAAVPAEPAAGGGDSEVTDEEVRSLEVLQEVEEEEEDETKEDIKAHVLEETILEEDEEMGKEEDGVEAGEEEEVEAEKEESSAGDEEQEETGGEEAGEEEETSENGEEEEEAECKCQSARNEEGEEETAEGEDAEETSDNTGEDETGEEEGETGTGEEEEESDKETVKEAAAGEGETTENVEGGEEEEEEVSEFKEEEEEETTGRESGDEASGETEDDNAAKKEESTVVEELGEGNVSASADDEDDGDEEQGGEASEEERASPKDRGVTATEGEEADAEDSDTDGKRPSDTSADSPGPEGARATGEEDAAEGFRPEEEGDGEVKKRVDGALLHQYTRTSMESQPGSLEDVDTDAHHHPVISIEVPRMAGGGSAGGGTGQRRSRSPGRVKCRKPKETDSELDDF
ncbi:retinitis pigmentosa 1-like 1 protein [Cebidichthys violaceus]|uniref:retinitis pigmentosa 1-like 1 protein n=1 Tax=Cebidichthys violaceus TaxID=271503 RepID=UPI0035CB63A1